MSKIPKIFHFIRISPMKFEIYHYLAIMSTYVVNNPEKIYVYVDEEPKDNIFWECIKKYVIIEKIKPPKIFRGITVNPPQYQADIIRLEKLLERGGVYLDIDNLTLLPFDDLLNNDFVMGGSPKDKLDQRDYFDENSVDSIDAISNSIIMTIPDHPFIKEWYEKIHLYINDKYPWAYHAVCLPRDILRNNKEYFKKVKIIKWMKYFCPEGMWDDNPYILNEAESDKIGRLDGFYTLVFYQTIFYKKYLNKLTYFNIKNSKTIFSLIFKKYLDMMIKNEDAMIKLLWDEYYNQKWELLEKNSRICSDLLKNKKNNQYHLSVFFLAFSQLKLEKITDSKSNFINLLEENGVENNIKTWSVNNLKILAKKDEQILTSN